MSSSDFTVQLSWLTRSCYLQCSIQLRASTTTHVPCSWQPMDAVTLYLTYLFVSMFLPVRVPGVLQALKNQYQDGLNSRQRSQSQSSQSSNQPSLPSSANTLTTVELWLIILIWSPKRLFNLITQTSHQQERSHHCKK